MTRINPGIHSIQVGDVTVTALNDGQFTAGTGVVVGLSTAESESLLESGFRIMPPRISVSCFLLEWPDRRVILDFGAGGVMGNVLGHAAERLASLHVDPASVDAVLLTHGHPDHLGGLLTNGSATFPNATLHADATEIDFWNDPGNGSDTAGLARAALAAYAPRTERFSGAAAVIPGVTAVPLPGHTPGHTGFLISSGGESLLMWADVIHLPAIQFAEPKAGLAFDVDGAAAAASRMRALNMAASERILIAGIHLDFPTFGHVSRRGGGYAFEPVVWAPTATGLFAT